MPRSNKAIRPLDKYKIVDTKSGSASAVPLKSTRIDVEIAGGLALVTTERMFENTSAASIEATITFPVPVHAVFTGLEAEIDGRRLKGIAQRKNKARQTYEDAIDSGKTAILHEELLRGVHMVSVGHIPAGKTISVTSAWAMPVASNRAGEVQLRIPTTVGDIYGQSPLSDADDLIHGGSKQVATLSVKSDSGQVRVSGGKPAEGGYQVVLDAPIDVIVQGWVGRTITGRAADGRIVEIDVRQAPLVSADVDVDVIIDVSGSMMEAAAGHSRLTKFDLVTSGLKTVIREKLRAGDKIGLWKFADNATFLIRGDQKTVVASLSALTCSREGTEIGRSLETVIKSGEGRDILLLTDGKSHALNVQRLSKANRRIHVLLIGEDSLEANVGHLAAQTGGQLFLCTDEIDTAILNVFNAARISGDTVVDAPVGEMPSQIKTLMGGMGVKVVWKAARKKLAAKNASAKTAVVTADQTVPTPEDRFERTVGAVAASLALRFLDEGTAASLAEAEGLCGHLTSLVLVDHAGEAQEGIPTQHKIGLMTPRTRGIAISASGWAGSASAGGDLYASQGVMRSSLSVSSPRGGNSASWAGRSLLRSSRVNMDQTVYGDTDIDPNDISFRTPKIPDSTRPSDSFNTALQNIAWHIEPDELRQGDTRRQSDLLRISILKLTASISKLFSGLSNQERQLIIIATLAKAAGSDRNASRVYRAITKTISEDLVRQLEAYLASN